MEKRQEAVQDQVDVPDVVKVLQETGLPSVLLVEACEQGKGGFVPEKVSKDPRGPVEDQIPEHIQALLRKPAVLPLGHHAMEPFREPSPSPLWQIQGRGLLDLR